MKNRYEVRGDITAIFIEKRSGEVVEALIDTDDLDRVLSLDTSWWAKKRKCGYYINGEIREDGKRIPISLHRFIMNEPEGYVVDHINRNPADNRRKNLRLCTQSENCQNKSMQSNNTSGYRGVGWATTMNKWYASIGVVENGKRKNKYVGFYDSPEEANLAAVEARRNQFAVSEGEYNI